jgi:hypothetical protein
VCDAGKRPRSQDRTPSVAQQGDREGLLKRDGIRRADAFEEALSRGAGTKQHVVAVVERLATTLERRGAPAEARRTFADDDLVPIAGEAAGGSHSREASPNHDDARHQNLHAAVSRSRDFPGAGSEAREEK